MERAQGLFSYTLSSEEVGRLLNQGSEIFEMLQVKAHRDIGDSEGGKELIFSDKYDANAFEELCASVKPPILIESSE